MSGSREESPDWLRSFQAPTLSMTTLPSDSDSEEPSQVSLLDRKNKTQGDGDEDGDEDDDDDDGKVIKKLLSEKHVKARAPKSSVWELSSDNEEELPLPKKEEEEDSLLIVRKGKSPTKKSSKGKSPRKGPKITGSPKKEKDENDNMKVKGNDGNETVEEDAAEKRTEPHVSTSTLPLVLSEKVQRTKALVECEGESIDLSGDMGAVGRIVIPDTANGSDEMYLDLKGTIYKTSIVPSRTFCVVSFGQSEAKIEAIMNDFIQLKPLSNVYEAETMVEGTLDGFSFDSEDEADKIPKATSNQTDQNDGVEVQTNGKVKKKAEKPSGTARKRGTGAGGKSQPPKKVRKKTVVSKKGKAKK